MSLNNKILKEFEVGGQKFWIQNVEKHQAAMVVDVMVNNFRLDEPVAQYKPTFKILLSLDYRQNSKDIVRDKNAYVEILKSGLCIVCMTKLNDVPVIAGIQCFEIGSADMINSRWRMGEKVLQYILKVSKLCEKLNIENYLISRGLFVFPEYRRKGIGHSLLQCRSVVCKMANQKVAIGIFSSKYAQAAAKRAGFIEVFKRSYEEIRADLPSEIPLGIENHTKELLLFAVYPST
ncbi:hypothetical protein FQR65_LT03765 [Abscondita terminalis]|nr:hypothetical protein FQR65_LT03765 [Abscondita terminalis]